jgi:hypothetical protein
MARIGKAEPDPEGEKDPQKKVKKFHVLKCYMFSFER